MKHWYLFTCRRVAHRAWHTQRRRVAGDCGAGRLFWLSCLLVAAATTMGLPPAVKGEPKTAIPTTDFLNSIGIDSTFPDRGQPIDKTVAMVKYVGFRWVRGGH